MWFPEPVFNARSAMARALKADRDQVESPHRVKMHGKPVG
jgi:hypothetical protein